MNVYDQEKYNSNVKLWLIATITTDVKTFYFNDETLTEVNKQYRTIKYLFSFT